MDFNLSPSASQQQITDALNYVLANLGSNSLVYNQTTGQITSGNTVIGYLYRYLAVKYATSFNGVTGFSDSPTNATYYGLYNSNNAAESSNPANYIWSPTNFGTTNFFYYLVTGGRKLTIYIGTTAPASTWSLDTGTSIDLDNVAATSASPSNFTGGFLAYGLDGEDGQDGVALAGPQGNPGPTGGQGPQGVATYLEAEVIEPEMFLVPGTPGPAGNPGSTGATGPQGVPAMPFGLDGEDGQDGISIVGLQGPAGTNGTNGTNGINGLNGFGIDGIDGEDGIIGPQGPQGISGINGVNGTNGANGLDGLDGEEGSIWLISPPTVSSGSSGVSQIVAGTNVSISPAGGTGIVTINASGGGGTWTTVQNSTLVTDTMTVTAGFQFLCARTFNNVGSIINNGDFVITH